MVSAKFSTVLRSPDLRRLPLLGGALVAGVAALLLATGVAANGPRRSGPAAVHVRVGGVPGRPVARSFVGLSVEYTSLRAYSGPSQRPNRPFAALLDTLARAQHAAPALRIGGNTADRAWWNPAGLPRPPSVRTDLGRGWLAALAALERRVHAPLTLTLNLALQRPANAAAFAATAQRALPPGTLRGLEIGNEPDIYGRRRPTAAGVLGPTPFPGLQPYTKLRYVRDVARYATALASGLRPLPPLVVGGFAGIAWNATVPALTRAAVGPAQAASLHAYPLYGCGARRNVSIGSLLSTTAARQLTERVRRTIRMDRIAPGRLRLGELNSVACGGRAGVSDTFASALWSTDAFFALAHAGVAGADIHTFAGARYAPFAFARSGGVTRAQVRPLYYGMLLFARATPSPSRLVAVDGGTRPGLGVWATIDARRTLRIVAVNSSAGRAVALSVSAAGRGAVAHAALLRAPGLSARGHVTFGGQAVGADGRLHGRPRALAIAAHAGVYRLRLAPASAALITIPAGR